MIRLFFLIISCSFLFSQSLKPYILGAISDASVQKATNHLKSNLEENKFTILGEYSPAGDMNRYVLVVTNDELKSAVSKVGGLTGFGAAIRVSVTKNENQTEVAYVNPIYLGNAYFGNDYSKVSGHYATTAAFLTRSMAGIGTEMKEPFGSEDGLSAKELRGYNYMFGMEKFDDVVTLKSFSSYNHAVKALDENLASGVNNCSLVYSIAFPDQELKLYGIGLSGETGEEHFLPIIDITSPKHSAFLPYEILVMGDEAVMLHGRYRIALSFPDLTMMTFGKIMSTPGDIKDLMQSVTETR